MAITETEYLFVYGTLMQEYRDNPFAKVIKQYAAFESEAFTTGKLFLVDYYPGLIEAEESSYVYGEIYRIYDSKSLFEQLDEYEDYNPENLQNSLFRRKKIPVFNLLTTLPVVAWTYVYNQPTDLLLPIESGKFLAYLALKSKGKSSLGQ